MGSRTWAAAWAALALTLGAAGCRASTEEPGAEEPRLQRPPALSPLTTKGRPVTCTPDDGPEVLPETFWGMHVTSPTSAGFPDAPITAVNLTTSGVYWNQVEITPGQYDFDRLDEIVSETEERGARPMLVLGSTPVFHAGGAPATEARAAPPDPEAWRAWVTAAVGRYGDRLDYQVWPEPNIESNWSGSPEEMAALTAVASEVVRSGAPDALVVAPATTLRLDSQREWMRRFWSATVDGGPVGDLVDAAALDPFPLEEGTPEDSVRLVCLAREILAEAEVGLPVWTNEINYGVPSGGAPTGVEPYSDELQAAVLARTYVLHAAAGLDRVYWLGWFSYPGVAVELERDGETTPAGEAFTVVHDWLAGTPRPVCRVHERTVHHCQVDRGSERVSLLWQVVGSDTVAVPPGVDAVETLDGVSRPAREGESLELGPQPVALVARGD